MVWVPAEMKQVHAQVLEGKNPTVTVRSLLGWFSSERRGSRVVSNIQAALRHLSMLTKPNFEDAWIDGEVTFFSAIEPARSPTVPPPEPQATVATPELPTSAEGTLAAPQPPAPLPEPPPQQAPNVRHDPVFRLGKLAAANRPPVTVHPDTPLSRAVTLMMLQDFSQLPVATSSYRIDGVVSWKSIAQEHALRSAPATVRDCMGFAPVYDADDSFFEALGEMTQHGFVLVTSKKKLQGIVTLADVAAEFRGSFEPFVLIGEIERHLRLLVDRFIPLEQIREICGPTTNGPIDSVADLSFGQYLRLLEREEFWSRCALRVDRAETIRWLNEIREVRNEMMHFQSEAVDPSSLVRIREMAVFLREVLR